MVKVKLRLWQGMYTEQRELKVIRLLMLVCLLWITSPFYRPMTDPLLSRIQIPSKQDLMPSWWMTSMRWLSSFSFQWNEGAPLARKSSRPISGDGVSLGIFSSVSGVQKYRQRYRMNYLHITPEAQGFSVTIPSSFSEDQIELILQKPEVQEMYRTFHE
ncbi:MAG TPA: hypothetical protein QF353_06735 [Gammaproteobacteria bacterium]|nr:hypothetical protein [Gammaproteobacteria bacterium]